ncbi:MAG: tRNA uridine-5-carboxymethylaminomethyl(34) synthesis GTPase MnmE [Alphaproteobacteria bacterium]
MAAHEDTIFAMATAPGRAGVAVLRLSGPRSGSIAELLAGSLPAARKAAFRTFRDEFGNSIDQGLLLWFPAPNSFTGEAVVELHLHGGHAIVEYMLRILARLPGTRAAQAGEFSRRAFENGKLDLTAVEGLADLVAAETEAQRRQALRQMEGRLGALYEEWRVRLLQSQAYLEADIDFTDEELPDGLYSTVFISLTELCTEIRTHLADNQRGEILRRGYRIAILGAPNVGKSSLLNMLAKREAAIVTPVAGTTRDVIEVNLDLGGYPVSLVDTAGLRRTDDVIEAEGIRRAKSIAGTADLRLLVFDAGTWPDLNIDTLEWRDQTALCVINKIDLHPGISKPIDDHIHISVLNGTGVDELLQRIQNVVAARLGGGETPGLTRERHRRDLLLCLECLERALGQTPQEVELIAEDVRLAARSLGRITGRTDVEDMLDVLFGELCIGK